MRKKILVFSFTAAVIFIIVVFVCSTYFGNSPLNMSLSRKNNFISILPEGWAFFTISSESPRTYFFKVEKNDPKEISLRNFSLKYAFGFNRNNRVYNIQLDHLHNKLNNDTIYKYTIKASNVNNIFEHIKLDTINYNALTLEKKMMPNVDNGDYLVVVQEMLPWSMLHRNINYKSNFTILPVSFKVK